MLYPRMCFSTSTIHLKQLSMILSSNSIFYIIYGILLQFLVEVKSQKTAFNPDLRHRHTATLINDKLYILGGTLPGDTNTKSPKETFLYLDVSVPFDTNGLKWIDISSNNIIPPHSSAASIKGGANNNTLFLYGGLSPTGEAMGLVYAFSTQDNTWGIPKITGVPPTGKMHITPIVDYNGLMYLFSGALIGKSSGISGNDYTNDMLILDTIHLSWKKASAINAPAPRGSYGAVFLPSKNIIYMGGFNSDAVVRLLLLNEVDLYDTVNDIWTTKTTTGLTPSARYGFSSVLGLDGQRVIIFGGPLDEVNSATSLYVLDTNNFNWYIPKVTGKIPSNRIFHRAVLIGKYMAVTFGSGYTQGVDSDILLLDISNNDEFIWTTSFIPLPPPAPTPVPQPTNPSTTSSTQSTSTNTNTSSSNNTGVIVGSVIGSLFGGILLTVGSFFLYRRYKNIEEQNHAIPTPGERGSYPQEISQIPRERTTYYQSQQVPPSQFQPIYNYGQENIPIYENTRSLAQQNVDQNALQNIIAQAVREEVDSRMARNFNQGSE